MSDRTIRNLDNLTRSASTARVLNLLRVHAEHGQTEAWAEAPLFKSPILNRSLVLKHRLRRDEIDRFRLRRHVATKVILPIDSGDLRVGGRYFFINQIGYDKTLEEMFGIGPGHPDIRTLAVIESLPGLDPFLLREQLRRKGVEPAPCYFNLREADLAQMSAFVANEISPLVNLSLNGGAVGDLENDSSAVILTAKILSNSAGEDLSALGLTLRLPPEQYEEGVFSWKGFLYYKWALKAVIGDVGGVVEGVRKAKPLGKVTPQEHGTLARSREMVRQRIMATCESTSAMLRVYDDAFKGLTEQGNPTAFRDFLLDAPMLFARLGERLGAIQHIVSFWNFRMHPKSPQPSAEELIDLLSDFENSLLSRDDPPQMASAA